MDKLNRELEQIQAGEEEEPEYEIKMLPPWYTQHTITPVATKYIRDVKAKREKEKYLKLFEDTVRKEVWQEMEREAPDLRDEFTTADYQAIRSSSVHLDVDYDGTGSRKQKTARTPDEVDEYRESFFTQKHESSISVEKQDTLVGMLAEGMDYDKLDSGNPYSNYLKRLYHTNKPSKMRRVKVRKFKEGDTSVETRLARRADDLINMLTEQYCAWLIKFGEEDFEFKMTPSNMQELFKHALEADMCPPIIPEVREMTVLPFPSGFEAPQKRNIPRLSTMEFVEKPNRLRAYAEKHPIQVPQGLRHKLYGRWYLPIKKWESSYRRLANIDREMFREREYPGDVEGRRKAEENLAAMETIEHYNRYLERTGKEKPRFLERVLQMKKDKQDAVRRKMLEEMMRDQSESRMMTQQREPPKSHRR